MGLKAKLLKFLKPSNKLTVTREITQGIEYYHRVSFALAQGTKPRKEKVIMFLKHCYHQTMFLSLDLEFLKVRDHLHM